MTRESRQHPEEALELLRARFPALDLESVRVVDDGWDSLVLEVDGAWIFRFPRRPEVAEWMERELALLPGLAAALPVAVPQPEHVARNGMLCVGYAKIAGSPARSGLTRATGRDLGRFLEALHSYPSERAAAAGVPVFDAATWGERLKERRAEFRRRVLPLLPTPERTAGERLLSESLESAFEPALIHGDLGPGHVLCNQGRIVGVIDWSDARVGDPALDLAWCLHGTPPHVAEAVADAYPIDDELRERALHHHRLGPWYEVVHGLETGQAVFVTSGLAGVVSRLSV